MTSTTDIVAKLWSLCHVLRDDGVTYNEYVTELTYLLFLKMLEETGRENRFAARRRRWLGRVSPRPRPRSSRTWIFGSPSSPSITRPVICPGS